MLPKLSALALALLSIAAATLAAVETPHSQMAEPGRLLVSEDFAKPVTVSTSSSLFDLKTGWRLKPGKWEFVDHALKGTQVAADHHSAVAAYALGFRDVIIQFDVQLNGCKQAIFRVNDANEHICRVVINPKGFSAQKDDHDHTGPDQAVPFGTVAMPIAAGTWETVTLEICGEEFVASMRGRSVVGRHPLIGTAKATIGFVVTGESGSFRNLRIWEASRKADWEKTKARLQAALSQP